MLWACVRVCYDKEYDDKKKVSLSELFISDENFDK